MISASTPKVGRLLWRVFELFISLGIILFPVGLAKVYVATHPMPRVNATAVTLADGETLVIGGYKGCHFDFSHDCSEQLATVERYDVRTGHTTSAGVMAIPRQEHTATLLTDGRVLVVGGARYFTVYTSPEFLASAEIYDPATNRWVEAAPLHTPRRHHNATLLPNGKVLITGGDVSSAQDPESQEIYDVATDTWRVV